MRIPLKISLPLSSLPPSLGGECGDPVGSTKWVPDNSFARLEQARQAKLASGMTRRGNVFYKRVKKWFLEMPMRLIKATLSPLCLLLLAGCSLFPNASGDPPRKFMLDILQSPAASSPQPYHLVLSDSFPIVYAPLDTVRLSLKPSPHSLDTFAESEWAERLGSLIRASFYFSLQNARLFTSVSGASEVVSAERMLILHVQDFQINCSDVPLSTLTVGHFPQKKRLPTEDKTYQGPYRYGFVRYLAELIELPSRRLLAARTFQKAVPVEASSIEEVVQALNKAHLQAMEACITWLAEPKHSNPTA